MKVVEAAQFSIFHIFGMLGIALGSSMGGVGGYQFFGMIGLVGGGLVGAYCGGWLGQLPERWARRSLFREIESASNEELWSIVNEERWNFRQSLALLHLSSRGENVRSEKPRIIVMLESDQPLQRIFGWDALRLVFPDLAKQLENYNPKESHEECLLKVRQFQAEN